MSKNVPATVVACAAVVAVVGPGFCRGATCLVRSSISLVGSAKYLQGINNKGIRGRTTQREVLAVALA